jgi:hypothetical protein
MALMYEGMACSICGRVIVDLRRAVACTHFIADKSDPLWPFSDSAMHPECFAGWEMRDAFVARYNEIMGAITWGNGTYHEMQPDGRIKSKLRGTSN